jgi:hypothetical protein
MLITNVIGTLDVFTKLTTFKPFFVFLFTKFGDSFDVVVAYLYDQPKVAFIKCFTHCNVLLNELINNLRAMC